MLEGSDVTRMESTIKNKWRWAWLDEKDDKGKLFRTWCKKLSEPGACFCCACNKKLLYGSNGKKALFKHNYEPGHQAAVRALQHTTVLPGATVTSEDARISMTDRVCNQKVRICTFIAEHDLSFTIARPLVDLIRAVASDKNALSRLSVSNSHASYVCTHGISSHMKTVLTEKMDKMFFSLNADEATNANMDRVLNILVRYYDGDLRKVVTHHLATRKVNIADAPTLTKQLTDILQSYSVNWNQVVSILLDNCAVMRGKKAGVETLARKENTALLDISGDTVHMVSHASKALLTPFQDYVKPSVLMSTTISRSFPSRRKSSRSSSVYSTWRTRA